MKQLDVVVSPPAFLWDPYLTLTNMIFDLDICGPWDTPGSLETINKQFILFLNGFKELLNKRGVCGNGQTMAIVSDHRSTDVSQSGDDDKYPNFYSIRELIVSSEGAGGVE